MLDPRVVDWRQVAALELDVHHRPNDLDHLPRRASACLCHRPLPPDSSVRTDFPRPQPSAGPGAYSAAAPDTTSMSSRVMVAWRTLFM